MMEEEEQQPQSSTVAVLPSTSTFRIWPSGITTKLTTNADDEKATLVIDGRDKMILSANEKACSMFLMKDSNKKDLIGRKLGSLFTDFVEGPLDGRNTREPPTISEAAYDSFVPIYGKVVDIAGVAQQKEEQDSTNSVSLWLYRVSTSNMLQSDDHQECNHQTNNFSIKSSVRRDSKFVQQESIIRLLPSSPPSQPRKQPTSAVTLVMKENGGRKCSSDSGCSSNSSVSSNNYVTSSDSSNNYGTSSNNSNNYRNTTTTDKELPSLLLDLSSIKCDHLLPPQATTKSDALDHQTSHTQKSNDEEHHIDNNNPSRTKGHFLLAVCEPTKRLRARLTIHDSDSDDASKAVFNFRSSSDGGTLSGGEDKWKLPGWKNINGSHFFSNSPSVTRFLTARSSKNHDRVIVPIKVRTEPILNGEESGAAIINNQCSQIVIDSFESISGVLTVFSADGKLHSFNTDFVRDLLGYSEDDLRDSVIEDILPDFGCEPAAFDSSGTGRRSQQELTINDVGRPKSSTNDLPLMIPSTMGEPPMAALKSSAAVTYQVVRKFPLSPVYVIWLAWAADPFVNFQSLERSRTSRSPQDSFTHEPHVGQDDQQQSEKIVDPDSECSSELTLESDKTLLSIAGKDFLQEYDIIDDIEEGAFGAVKLTVRKTDGSQTVTKFIDKSKVLKDCWISGTAGKPCQNDDENGVNMVPIEIELLTTLKHPNIVKVISVFSNDNFYQMVMEKHGQGMDLFTFIERRPVMDEALVAYIFRQVASGVSYLQSHGVVHRDIKEENVIIDERFRCKLIDFGSAAYYGPGKTFTVFCGTVDNCSPEVLLGNSYAGPELEMWNLGVLLYTLVFLEPPFSASDRTQSPITADYNILFPISDDLSHLLGCLLHRDPFQRARIQDVQHDCWVTQPVAIEDFYSVFPYSIHSNHT